MANTKVVVKIVAPENMELYIVGNTSSLGNWNASKAVKLEYDQETKSYSITKMLPLNETIEFKILAGKSWEFVEKGDWNEEVPNHTFIALKGSTVKITINNFSK